MTLRRVVKGIEAQLIRLGYAQLLALAELDQRNIVGELQLRGLPDLLSGRTALYPIGREGKGQRDGAVVRQALADR